MMILYEMVEPKDGVNAQFAAVHMVKWRAHMGEPKWLFREVGSERQYIKRIRELETEVRVSEHQLVRDGRRICELGAQLEGMVPEEKLRTALMRVEELEVSLEAEEALNAKAADREQELRAQLEGMVPREALEHQADVSAKAEFDRRELEKELAEARAEIDKAQVIIAELPSMAEMEYGADCIAIRDTEIARLKKELSEGLQSLLDTERLQHEQTLKELAEARAEIGRLKEEIIQARLALDEEAKR